MTVGSGITTSNLVLGTIKMMHVDDDVLTSNQIVDWKKIQVIGRLSGNQFCHVDSGFEIKVD